jgi:hypothetical protein
MRESQKGGADPMGGDAFAAVADGSIAVTVSPDALLLLALAYMAGGLYGTFGRALEAAKRKFNQLRTALPHAGSAVDRNAAASAATEEAAHQILGIKTHLGGKKTKTRKKSKSKSKSKSYKPKKVKKNKNKAKKSQKKSRADTPVKRGTNTYRRDSQKGGAAGAWRSGWFPAKQDVALFAESWTPVGAGGRPALREQDVDRALLLLALAFMAGGLYGTFVLAMEAAKRKFNQLRAALPAWGSAVDRDAAAAAATAEAAHEAARRLLGVTTSAEAAARPAAAPPPESDEDKFHDAVEGPDELYPRLRRRVLRLPRRGHPLGTRRR